jgi:hypothetical protein
MRNTLGLVAGAGLIFVALFLASGTTTQDTAPRPQVARMIGTVFHQTPTLVPTPLPTRVHLNVLEPSTNDILNLLFQYPYKGMDIVRLGRAVVQPVFLFDAPYDDLVVIGDGAIATDGSRALPAAYGAILVWEYGEYVVEFEHIEWGQTHPTAQLLMGAQGEKVTFIFQNVSLAESTRVALQRRLVVGCYFKWCEVAQESVEPITKP